MKKQDLFISHILVAIGSSLISFGLYIATELVPVGYEVEPEPVEIHTIPHDVIRNTAKKRVAGSIMCKDDGGFREVLTNKFHCNNNKYYFGSDFTKQIPVSEEDITDMIKSIKISYGIDPNKHGYAYVLPMAK